MGFPAVLEYPLCLLLNLACVVHVLVYFLEILEVLFHLVDGLLSYQTEAAFLDLLHVFQHLDLGVQLGFLSLQLLDVEVHLHWVCRLVTF